MYKKSIITSALLLLMTSCSDVSTADSEKVVIPSTEKTETLSSKQKSKEEREREMRKQMEEEAKRFNPDFEKTDGSFDSIKEKTGI